MRYKVPHNIDMQDRIIGPLTMIQFVEAVIGSGLAYICISSIPNVLGIFLGIIIALFTLAVVFLKINERPFIHFLLSLVQFIINPKQRSWHKETRGSLNVQIIKSKKAAEKTINTKHLDRERIETLAHSIDSEGYKNIKI